MPHYPTSNRFINALINTYHLDVEVNRNKKNAYTMFSPYRIESTWFNFAALQFFGLITLFLFPLYPLIKPLRNIGVTNKGSNSLLITSSEKSESVYRKLKLVEGRSSISLIDGSSSTSFNTKQYLTYLKSCLCFFRVFNYRLWFYPAILHIPKMISFEDALKELEPEEIIFTNHYDRWTYLILDYCDNALKKSVLIQHGLEDDTSLYPKFKYENLWKLFCYNDIQYNYFHTNIFKKITETEYFKPSVELSQINDNYSVLIVGHGDPSVVSEEIMVIRELATAVDGLKIYVKPHPVFNTSSKYVFEYDNVQVITERNYYPDVDVLLHSGSTLAEEYSNCSTKVKVLSLLDYNEIIK
jgi:hypothetical protein